MADAGEEICSICLKAFKETQRHKIYNLDCEHAFHIKCLKKWIREYGKKKCPTCRTRISQDDMMYFTSGTFDMERLRLESDEEEERPRPEQVNFGGMIVSGPSTSPSRARRQRRREEEQWAGDYACMDRPRQRSPTSDDEEREVNPYFGRPNAFWRGMRRRRRRRY